MTPKDNELQNYVNIRWKVKTNHWLISKAGIDYSIDYDAFSVSNDGSKVSSITAVRLEKYRSTHSITNTVSKICTHKNKH